ncbi:hypothetical protein Acr_00g0042340 [Actinidia rufa]|uniref:Uncharacterized protein n=1 Tax=Actinidia rufa TaxID=165716 RepID=A0A7J0DIA3_9ERIC|nr:hypothetical protein Acr_00g0042340 [Actinidia rufa]
MLLCAKGLEECTDSRERSADGESCGAVRGENSNEMHDETSAHGLWTKLKEMYQEKTSQNKALMRRLVLKLQRGTIVAEQMSKFQRRGHMKRSGKEAREEVSRRRRDKKNCPRNKTQDQSSEAATTAIMAVDDSDVLLTVSADEESDWISDSGNAYHLCRDREVFSTHVACEGLVRMANNTTKSCWQRNSPVPHGRREIHKGNAAEEGRLKGYTYWRGVSKQEELLSDIGPMVLARRMDKGSKRCTKARKASAKIPKGYTEERKKEEKRKREEEREVVDSFCQQGLRKKSQMEAPSSSIVKNGGMYELSHELIFSSLWPINSEGCLGRRESEQKCNPWGGLLGAHNMLLCAKGLGECTDSIERFADVLEHNKMGNHSADILAKRALGSDLGWECREIRENSSVYEELCISGLNV